MRYNIIRNWIESAALMAEKSFIIIPFLVWGFLEALALECIYFFPGVPFGPIVNPIVAKYFGEAYAHYPGNLVIVSKLFYYAQSFLFVVVGVFLSAMTIDLIRRIDTSDSLLPKDIFESAIRRYIPCFIYGIIIVAAGFVVKKYSGVAFQRYIGSVSAHIPGEMLQLLPFASSLWMLTARIAMLTLFILTVPIIVIKRRSIIMALPESIFRGLLGFFPIFIMLLMPHLLYLPILLLKSFMTRLANATFPEVVFPLTLASIGVMAFIQCFIIVCASRIVLDRQKTVKGG